MDPTTLGTIVAIAMVAMLLLRIPVGIALVTAGYSGIVAFVSMRGSGFELARGLQTANQYLGDLPYTSAASYTFTTIPMFILMGYLASEAGYTRDLYNAAKLWLARVPGGLAVGSAAGCALFAAISGSSLATAAAMGRMAVPEMLRSGYAKGLATGVVAAAGTLGSLIPPSILLILYAIFTNQSIGKLFVAGIIPGLLSLGMYIVVIQVRVKLNPSLAPPVPGASLRERMHSLKSVWAMLLTMVVVIGGLYGGIFTPAEAGSIGAAVVFLIAIAGRRLKAHQTSSALLETLKATSMIFIAVIGAYLVTSFFSLTGIAGALAGWAGSITVHPLVILLLLTIVYVVLGMFMGPLEIMLLTLPAVIPIIQGLGYDLIWFGIILVKYVEIGLITPPVGLNCFVIDSITDDSITLSDIFKGVSWFILADLVTIAILVMFPGVVTWLPDMM